MPEDMRQLKITGGAAVMGMGRRGSTRKRAPKARQEGGFDDPPGMPVLGAANFIAARRISNSLRGGAAPAPAAPALPVTTGGTQPVTMVGHAAPNALQLGGVPAVRASLLAGAMPPGSPLAKGGGPVTMVAGAPSVPSGATPLPSFAPTNAARPPSPNLAPSAHGGARSKLVLAPSRKKAKSLILAPPVKKVKGKKGAHQTRKIRVQLGGLKKRMTKAKKIHDDSVTKPIAEVRAVLEKANLVKPLDSKSAPSAERDKILRGIYKDYLLLRNKAL